jgi:hypothetical protein
MLAITYSMEKEIKVAKWGTPKNILKNKKTKKIKKINIKKKFN